MNSAIIIKEIEFICLKLQKKLSQIYPDGFTAEFYQIFEELIPIIHKLLPEKKKFLPENRGRGDTLHSFYETSISLIPKLNKNSTKKKTKDKYPS